MNEFLERDIETVITVCDNADHACPTYHGQANRYHWPFPRPGKGQRQRGGNLERLRAGARRHTPAYSPTTAKPE